MRRVAAAATVVLLTCPGTAVAQDPLALGKELYVERCVLCHGSKGHGWDWTQKVAKPPVPVPDLVQVVPKREDEYLRRIILDGGEAVGKSGLMPAFRFKMDEAEVQALIQYLRALGGARKAK